MTQISRREFSGSLGLGLAGLVLEACSSQKPQQKPDSSASSDTLPPYKVLDAYIDSYGERVLQIQFPNERGLENTLFEIKDLTNSKGYKNLGVVVWYGRLLNDKPHPILGYDFGGMAYEFRGIAGGEPPLTEALCNLIYKAEVASGRKFRDLSVIEPEVKLNESEYRRVHNIGDFRLQTKDGKKSYSSEITIRIKYAAGLDTRQHMVFVLPPLIAWLNLIYDELTGREWCEQYTPYKFFDYENRKMPRDNIAELKKRMIKNLPEILKGLNLKGQVVVPLEVFPEMTVPESYRRAFPDLRVVGNKYKVAVFTK